MSGHIKRSIEIMAGLTLARPKVPIPNKYENIDPINTALVRERIISYFKIKDIINGRMQKNL